MLQEVEEQFDSPYQLTASLVAIFALAAIALRLLGKPWVAIIATLAVGGVLVVLVVVELRQEQPETWRASVAYILSVRRPSLRDLGVGVVAFIGGVLTTLGLATVKSLFAPTTDTASHRIASGTEPTQVALVALLVSVVVIGPLLEEILFRGVLQGLLANHIPAVVAITGVSLLFALLHIPAYGGLGASFQTLFWPLLVVFTNSLLFGVAHHVTGNVVTPWIAHGASNLLATGVWLL